ncbi:hypothetical protein CRUP_026647 [Coryphaenoides rupestris]|nr:hypothetical protein CRUP_026647 [Coryphaenoides rupestris]
MGKECQGEASIGQPLNGEVGYTPCEDTTLNVLLLLLLTRTAPARMDAAGCRPSAGPPAQCAAGPPERPPRTPGARPVLLLLLLGLLVPVTPGSSAVITGACEMDTQCGAGMCCAVSLWIRSLRMCTPMGQEGDDCHPMSHKGKHALRRSRSSLLNTRLMMGLTPACTKVIQTAAVRYTCGTAAPLTNIRTQHVARYGAHRTRNDSVIM